MRWFLALLPVSLLATTASAHGGGFRDGPPRIVEQGIPCDCGLIECDQCSHEPLRTGQDVRIALPSVREVKRWGDVARCRVEVAVASVPQRGMLEAYVRIEPGPLFAVVSGSVRNGDETLSGDLKPSETARREYLYARRMFNFDPMLALRRGPGRIDVRVYPLRKGVTATVVLEGYLLAEASRGAAVRLYRTDERYLAIVRLATDERRNAAAFRDWAGGRSLHFLTEAECRERYGSVPVQDVPFVPALESAVTSLGNRAASADTALVAIAVNSPQPPFVGPDRYRDGGPLREPSDPEPPPPPANDPGEVGVVSPRSRSPAGP